jgi:hypothetical protein
MHKSLGGLYMRKKCKIGIHKIAIIIAVPILLLNVFGGDGGFDWERTIKKIEKFIKGVK